jgi:exodeoxyribonuclease V alpha subunit
MSVLALALLDSLSRLLPAHPDDVAAAGPLITALAAALERGELALDLEGPEPVEIAAGLNLCGGTEGATRPSWPADHLQTLQHCGWLVQADALAAQPEAPLVQDGRWLRWRRWHHQLCQCRDALIARGQMAQQPAIAAAVLNEARQRAAAAGLDHQQCRAVSALLSQRLVLLSGGPGTGKTSTVVQMLAAALRLQPQLRLQLSAPTGKAAGRLAAAVAAGAAVLEPQLAEQLGSLPCSTLHRLLEARGDGEGFRRDARRPLDLDLLVVDEVSMVDLPLMAALLEALPEQAQLLLVGDPGQLAPVGPGAVLLELCRPEPLAALGPAAVELRTTYRNDGAIADLARRLRGHTSHGPSLLAELRPTLEALPTAANLRWLEAAPGRPPSAVLHRLVRHQQRLAELAGHLHLPDSNSATTPRQQAAAEALLMELEQLILLTPIRRGPWGVEGLHRALLGDAAQAPVQRWPLGTPVLNRRNLAEQGLANGDIGVVVRRAEERLVLFSGGRLLHPARLGGAEPALALTVHKAQGSQYAEVLLLLPDSQGVDARLVYTGLTRARRQALLITVQPTGEFGEAAAVQASAGG